MALHKAYTATRIIETLENYTIAGNLTKLDAERLQTENNHSDFLYDDEGFWRYVLNNPEQYWNCRYRLMHCTVSHWVPRVPGLFWAKGSEAIRRLSESEVALSGEGWKEYYPPGKSGKVLGGIGTFLFPPDNNGNILVSLTFSGNASVGIPALITAEVVEYHNIQQGDLLDIDEVKWIKMSMEWGHRFPSVRNIPRGYLCINNPSLIRKVNTGMGVQFHPCTIMEYESEGAILWDYVFVTTDNLDKKYRQGLERFFDYYKNKEGRNGKYLVASDIATPLFDATYSSPQELSAINKTGQSQLELINLRIQNETFNGQTIEDIIRFIANSYFLPDTVFALAQQAGMAQGKIDPGPAVSMVIQVVNFFAENRKLEQLIDAVALEHPEILNS